MQCKLNGTEFWIGFKIESSMGIVEGRLRESKSRACRRDNGQQGADNGRMWLFKGDARVCWSGAEQSSAENGQSSEWADWPGEQTWQTGWRGDELGAAGSGWLAERWPKERKRVTQRERCDGVEQSRAEFVLLASCIQWSFNNKEAWNSLIVVCGVAKAPKGQKLPGCFLLCVLCLRCLRWGVLAVCGVFVIRHGDRQTVRQMLCNVDPESEESLIGVIQ